jgi:large subunit ribosomal protein L13
MSFPGRAALQTWHLLDASNLAPGRISTVVSALLRGKHKPTYRPNKATGDNVVIINASKVKFTGKKLTDKVYRWHTGFPGGLKERSARDQLDRQPTKVLRKSILGMLSRNKLRHGYYERQLHIYPDEQHPWGEEFQKIGGPKEIVVGRARSGEKDRGYFGIPK